MRRRLNTPQRRRWPLNPQFAIRNPQSFVAVCGDG